MKGAGSDAQIGDPGSLEDLGSVPKGPKGSSPLFPRVSFVCSSVFFFFWGGVCVFLRSLVFKAELSRLSPFGNISCLYRQDRALRCYTIFDLLEHFPQSCQRIESENSTGLQENQQRTTKHLHPVRQ